jgi:hypothetical protein
MRTAKEIAFTMDAEARKLEMEVKALKTVVYFRP